MTKGKGKLRNKEISHNDSSANIKPLTSAEQTSYFSRYSRELNPQAKDAVYPKPRKGDYRRETIAEDKQIDFEKLERIVGQEIAHLSNEELKRKWQEISAGAVAYIGSLKGDGYVRGLGSNRNFTGNLAAYSYACDAYEFAKECIERGKLEKLKVKRNSRNVKYVPVKKVLLDALRRKIVFEELAKRN